MVQQALLARRVFKIKLLQRASQFICCCKSPRMPRRATATPASGEPTLLAAERPRETEFVTVRVGHMEEPLAPFRVARRGGGAVAGRGKARVQAVDVGVIANNTPPPGPGV